MKKTQLLLIMLLTLASSVWGADAVPSSLAFRWSTKGIGTLLGGADGGDKCITDGLFEWSVKGEDELKCSGEWISIKTTNPVEGRTRSQYHFQAGTYRFTFHFKTNGEQNIQYYDPQVSLDDGTNYYPASPASHTSDDKNMNGGTFSVDVPVASAGDYKVRVQFQTTNVNEKVQYSTVDIALQGGGGQGQGQGGEQGGGGQGNTPSGNCTNTVTFQCESDYILPEGKTIPSGVYFVPDNGGEYHEYTGSHPTDTKGYVDFKENTFELFYALSVSKSTKCSYEVWLTNANNAWINVYSSLANSGESVEYNGKTYYKVKNNYLNNPGKPFGTQTYDCNDYTMDPGDYIIGLYARDWTAFDQVIVTANTDAFCSSSTYTITYDHGTNGTGEIAAGEKTEGEDFTLSSSTFSRNGYRQTGWATTDGGAKAYDLGGTYATDEDITLYPYWEEDLTTVWYMKGTFVDDWVTQYDFVKAAGHSTESVATVTLENLAKNTAYWFKLWDNSNNYGQDHDGGKMTYDNNTWTLTGDKNVGMQTTAAGNYTFTVDFSGAKPQLTISYPNSYTITYYKNDEGATGSMAAEGYIEEGGDRTIPEVGFRKDHWHFLGWATSAEGEVVYADAATIENIAADINLYAKWAIDRFDVVYDGNGVDGYKGELPATVTYDYDTEVAVSDVVLEKFGYTFVGWNTNNEASIAERGTFHVTANKTFYAIWQVTKPTMVTIVPADGNYSPDKGTAVQMNVTLTPDANTMAIENRELTWSSTNATIAFVNQDGYVSFVGAGDVTITATSKVAAGVSGQYTFHVQAGSVGNPGWQIESYDVDGYGNTLDYTKRWDYFKKVGDHEWRCTYVLPNSSRKFFIGNQDGWWAKQYGGHSEHWAFDWLRLADYRANNNYPGQDAVGELVIWDNSNDNNWGVAFLPNYRMSYMVNGSQWRIMNFHNTQGYEYETDIFRVPAGYKDNASMKCYVGIQKANGDNMEVSGKSAQVSMNTIGGLGSSNMAGKYGKWHIYSNSSDANWYCQFIYYNNVNFEMNGGAGNIDPIYGKNGAGETFNTGDLTNPTRTGYTLTGWKDQNENTYTLNQDVTINADLVLTAQWAPATYTITLDKNNGAADGQATATYDNSALTSVTHVSRTGYDLTGYFTAATDGSMVVTAEGALVPSVANYTDESGRWIKPADAMLYAQWQAKQYIVTLDNQNATTAGQTNVTATYDAAMPSIAEKLPAKTGYTFGGYYDAENGAGTQYYTAEGASAHVWDKDAATTLYAKWTADTYSIAYTLNGGVNSGNNPENYTIESADIALVAPTRDNYTFAGWYTEAGFEHPITTIAHGSTGNKSLFAKWTPTPFNITYNLDGGTNHGDNPATYTVESAEITLLDPTKDGYDFQGWYTENTFDNQVTSIAAGSTGDKTFFAKWAENHCTNTLTIQCEDSYLTSDVVTGGTSSHSNLMVYTDGQGAGHTYSASSHGSGYVKAERESGREIYFIFDAPVAGTYNFNVWTGNDQEYYLNLYTTDGNSSQVTYMGTNYRKKGDGRRLNKDYGTEQFRAAGDQAFDLPQGRAIIGLYNGWGWPAYDQIVITGPGAVFCPTMYTVTFEQPANGSVSATILDGEAITSGTQVLEGTRVVFTCTPNDGYDFVKYNDGTSDITDNPYTVTVNSDLTITTTIEQEVVKHNLTASAAEHGSVYPTDVEVGEGRETTITATPDANYRFDHWEAVGYVLTGHENDNPLTVTMPTNDVALTAYFVFDEVHNLIATGTSANYDANQEGDGATLTITAMSDPEFNHDVMKFEYSNMSGHYAGKSIFKDGGYTPTSKATGFAFWYKTEKADDQVAFCFQKDDYQQVKWQLAATNGVWKYYYFADAAAANYSTGANLKIYMNGEDNGNTTRYNEGAYYITEIQATNVTAIPDYTITLDKNGGVADGSATATLNSNTLTSVTHVERTGHILQGYFTATSDGTKVINANGSLVASVDGYTDGSARWIKESDATLYAQWQAKVTHVTANANGGTYEHGTCNGDFPYGCSAKVSCFPEKTDYNFQGYTLTQNGDDYIFNAEGNMVDRAGYVADGRWICEDATLTIYAKWISATTYYDISVAASPADKGTVTMKVGDDAPTSDPVNVLAGTEIELTANCIDPTFAFKQWQDGNRDNPRTITATGDMTYTATFEQFFTITATMGEPGDRIEGADQKHFGGDQVTLTAVARMRDSGGHDYELTYGFKNWTNISGVELTDEQKTQNPLTFSMPYQNVSLKANFSPIECTSTKTIQCEDNDTYIKENDMNLDETNRAKIPNSGGCGIYNDHYTGMHGTYKDPQSGNLGAYYDFKDNSGELFYPVTLSEGTYQFVVWAASDANKDCWMNIYVEDPAGTDLTYKTVTYRKTNYVAANHVASSFAEAGTISGVVISGTKKAIVGLAANGTYASFDQIVITETTGGKVFCGPLSTEPFVINAKETKEVPVCGVANLIIYEGGEATNYDDFEVTESVKYIYTVAESDMDKWLTLCTPYQTNAITVVNDPDAANSPIWPLWKDQNDLLQAGYFHIKQLGNRNQTAMGEEFKQRWDVIGTQYPQDDKAYIVLYPSATYDSYFIGKQVSYNRTGAATIFGIKNATNALAAERIVSEPRFYYYPNHSMSTLHYEGDVYMLNEAGTNFDLQTNPDIRPFTCYIQATEEYKAKHRSLRMGDALEAEQGSTITTGIEHTDWTIELLLRDPDTRIYDMLGRSMSNIRQLPTGVYTLVNGDYSVKYVVK